MTEGKPKVDLSTITPIKGGKPIHLETGEKPLPAKPRYSIVIVGGNQFECMSDSVKKARACLDKGTHRPDIIIELVIVRTIYEEGRRELVTLETRADCIQGVIE